MTRARKSKETPKMHKKLINVRSKSSRRETSLTLDQVSVLRRWTSANDRLDEAIDRALESYPKPQCVDLPRHLKLRLIDDFLWAPQPGISREEFSRTIHLAIRLEGWVCKAVSPNEPKAVSRETVACAANDIHWMAGVLERLFDRTVSHLRVSSLSEGRIK